MGLRWAGLYRVPLAPLCVPVGMEATPWPLAQPGGSKGWLGCPPWLSLHSQPSPSHWEPMLGWKWTWVGDGLGRMSPSCPREAAAAARAGPPPSHPTGGGGDAWGHPALVQVGRGVPHPPAGPCSAVRSCATLGGAGGPSLGARSGVLAERVWCHTKGGFCHLIWCGHSAFHPPWSKPRGTLCHTVPCLPPHTAPPAGPRRRHASPVAFAGGVCVSQAD